MKNKSLMEALDSYTAKTEFPILKEFCFIVDIDYYDFLRIQNSDDGLHNSVISMFHKALSTIKKKQESDSGYRLIFLFRNVQAEYLGIKKNYHL